MAYYKLDYDEFFDPKYSNLNNGEGIGATGIITSNQSIHVFNDYDIDPKSQIEYIGLGKHDSKKSEILQDIYGIESSVKDVYLYKVISLYPVLSALYRRATARARERRGALRGSTTRDTPCRTRRSPAWRYGSRAPGSRPGSA